MNQDVEEKYLKDLSKGDQKAFEMLYLYYQPKLINFLSGMIKNDELSRDMAQDIFLYVWNNKTIFSEVKSFNAFIFKMGKNTICNHYDHLAVNEKYISKQLNKPTYSSNTEEDVYANQLQELIDSAINNMPPQRKLIYTMSRIEGVSNSEIAEQLKINKRTVENHLSSALSDIRNIMKTIIIFLSKIIFIFCVFSAI